MKDFFCEYECPFCNTQLEVDFEEDGARYVKGCHKCLKKHNVITHCDVWADTEDYECLNDDNHKMIFHNKPRSDVSLFVCECGKTEFRKDNP